jgi:enoyl-CoA hydratase/carnithine racemase
MPYQTIRYEVAQGIATITLSRPDKLNAFTAEMMDELLDALDRVDADDAIRAVIITGEGRAFCAGADLSNGASSFFTDGGAVDTGGKLDCGVAAPDGGGRVTLRLFKCLKPVIAAINGPAVGVGVTMTLAMDVRLASTDAQIGFVFARRGIVPEAASSYFLPRIVGIGQALEWCFSGKVFDAEEALRGGLVRSLHAPEDLLPAARALAREFADGTAPVSVALIRQMLWRGLDMSHPMEAHRLDSRGVFWRGRSSDAAEGIASFLDKRPPIFSDRASVDMPEFFPWWEEPNYE